LVVFFEFEFLKIDPGGNVSLALTLYFLFS